MAVARRLDAVTPLPVWEFRFRRSFGGSPTMKDVMAHFHALWAETEVPA
jgi:hypothetical protein